MVRVNILYMSFVLIVCRIKIVSSIVLDINDIVNSGLKVFQRVKNGIITTKVFSRPGMPITQILKGSRPIWNGYPGESVRSLTFITSEWSSETVLSIEVDNPVKEPTLYLHTFYNHYKYITIQSYNQKIKQILKGPRICFKKRKKDKGETDDTGEPEKKIRRQPNETTEPPPQQPLVPETIHFEISDSEEEEPTTTSAQQCQEDQTPEPTKPLVPETTRVEIGSDVDEETDTASGPSDDDDSNLLNESLFGEDVEKLLDRELSSTGLSKTELDSILEGATEEN
ncbi:TpHN family protein [Theileria parva strain Muguga]|uniref:Tash1 protein, putative n=1 Tax=Theileria parva TaxID=5875 RepID=Q4N865_THEPA|nr:uncharacterized protein TpMuguga_01g00605 [Theileria parva strain Muguga]EAN33843.1 TpHN family protein [Theileria parva strain Muguga]|eukprot:XP_766126.1 hypothetical protein [Theileria parva strain Muguga]